MHVGFFWDPSLFDYRGTLGNPYGGLLVEALQKHGLTFERLEYHLATGGQRPEGLKEKWVWRQRGRVQVLHLHWLSELYAADSAVAAWLKLARLGWTIALARLLGYRIVWTLHNLLPHERPHAGVDVAGRFLMAALAHAVICHCEYARRAFARRFRRRRNVLVIPHGNFLAAYPNTISKAEARERLDIAPNAFVYVVFGNIRNYKGHDELLEAFGRLRGDHLRLLIAGMRYRYRPGRFNLDGLADPRVMLRDGRVEIDDLQVIFNAADVAVFPYLAALTSGALITALGFARPVISSHVGCIPEVVDRPEIGTLLPPGDVAALAAAMEQAQGWDLDARGAAAYQRARELRWDAIARETLKAYGLGGAG